MKLLEIRFLGLILKHFEIMPKIIKISDIFEYLKRISRYKIFRLIYTITQKTKENTQKKFC